MSDRDQEQLESGSGRYDADFYSGLTGPSGRAAARILPLVLDVVQPASVVDIGCGTGAWLHRLSTLTDVEILGVDGDYVSRSQLEIPADRFLSRDLGRPFSLPGRFDLAMSLEVAEHLPPERAASFVADLTALAPVVLFSAAVPFQGGVHHVNEQWPSYWIEKFEAGGFEAWDVIRPFVWDDDAVEFYYRQNMFLFVDRTFDLPRPEPTRELVDCVHPEMLRRLAEHEPSLSLRALTMQLPGATSRAVRHRLSQIRSRPR